MEKKMKK